jgi:sn-glycerol 3-phosphate transport system permease protein
MKDGPHTPFALSLSKGSNPPSRNANPSNLRYNQPGWLDAVAAWLLAILWILPLAYAVWTAFHPSEYSTRFDLLAPLTLDNFRKAWEAAPFARYFLNTTLLVAMILSAQLVICTLAAYAFARFQFCGKNMVFAIVLIQLMVMPDILLVENYKTMARLGLVDTLLAIGLPYFASAFCIFLLRQTFMGIPKELVDAARVEGASALQILMRVYVPLAKPVYTAFALVSVSFHWNNFLWPVIITNSVNARPLTVGLQVFASTDQGIDWSIITAATLMTSAPLLIAFLLFQRQFVQSFMRAGIK